MLRLFSKNEELKKSCILNNIEIHKENYYTIDNIKQLQLKCPSFPFHVHLKPSQLLYLPQDLTQAEQELRNKKKAEMEVRRLALQRNNEEKVYNRMTKGLTNSAVDSTMQRELNSTKQHLSIGANMMVARITAFIAMYFVSGSVTQDESKRILAGLMGAVVMLAIEMMLHIVRETKLETYAKKLRQKQDREEKRKVKQAYAKLQ